MFERRILGFLGFSAGENVRDDHVPVLGKTVFRGFALNDDFSFAVQGLSRFRVSAYKQRGALSAVVRVITFDLPKPEDIGIPQNIIDLGLQPKGMVLVTGPAGSGKSTTLACMVDALNRRCAKHIITLEDPIEYLHSHQHGIISQREINVDTVSYTHLTLPTT